MPQQKLEPSWISSCTTPLATASCYLTATHHKHKPLLNNIDHDQPLSTTIILTNIQHWSPLTIMDPSSYIHMHIYTAMMNHLSPVIQASLMHTWPIVGCLWAACWLHDLPIIDPPPSPQGCPERCRTICCTLESTGDLLASLEARCGRWVTGEARCFSMGFGGFH